MNRRMLSIIYDLADLDEEYTISSLARKHSVSERTIRNDLNGISDLLRENGSPELKTAAGGRILREPAFREILSFVSEADFYSYKLSAEERIRISAVMLVSTSGFLTLAAIADTLFVSRATIIGDLEKIKGIIAEKGLRVVSHPSKGLRVEGDEYQKRAFLVRYIVNTSESPQRGIGSSQISILGGDRTLIRKILREQEHVHRSHLTDDSFRKLLIYLRVLISRVEKGEYITGDPAPCSGAEASGKKYLMAQDVLQYVSRYCHIRVVEPEIRQLSVLLSEARYLKQQDYRPDSIRIQTIARRFSEAVSEELGEPLDDDYDFFESLSNHLESVFTEKRPEYPVNAVVREVLGDHPEVRSAVEASLPVLEQQMVRVLEEPEIEYICIHVCAALEKKRNREVAFHVILACHAGIGTSHLLLERLKRNFRFQIVDIVSAHEAEELPEKCADLVISTVPLQNCRLEQVVVSPLLGDEDYLRISSKISSLRNSRNLPDRVTEEAATSRDLLEKLDPVLERFGGEEQEELKRAVRKVVREFFRQPSAAEAEIFSPALHHLLTPEHIQLDVVCADWKEAVEKAAAPLLSEGCIEPGYIPAMIRNIEENGPYVVLCPGFAVPHEGLNMGSIKLGLNLIRLKEPVCFGDPEYDPVRFVCCLSPVDRKMHLKAFFNLVNMIKSEEYREALLRAKSPEEAAAVIARYEYSK